MRNKNHGYTAGLMFGLISTFALAAPNDLTKVGVTAQGDGAEVRVACSQAPIFNVFRLKDPDRLIVDVSNASVAGIKGHHEGVGPVTGVVASQFSDAKNEVGRLLLGLDGAKRYDVRAEGTTLIVSIERTAGAPEAAAKPVAPPAVVAAVTPDVAPAADAPPANTGDAVLASRVDEKPVKVPATRLKSISATESTLRLLTDGELARFEVIELADPPRLALDLTGVAGGARAPRVHKGNVKDVRVGAHEDKVRVVVEFAQRATFDVRRRSDGLSVTFGVAAPDHTAQTPAPQAEGEPEAVVEIDGKPVPVAEQADDVAEVTDVKFIEARGGGVVQLALKGAPRWKVERPDAKSAVLNLENTRVARQLERSLDTSALATVVKMVSVFSVPGGAPRVRVVVAGGEALEQSLTARGTLLQWRFNAPGAAEQTVAENEAAGFSTESNTVADEGAPQQRRGYVGKRVSFEFKDIDIHNLLRIIAEISKKNIVVSDDVNGKVTVRLRNVPWDQALDLVLRSKGLGKEEFGNIIRVAPLTVLETEAHSRAERLKSARAATPLQVALIPVNYATAAEMSQRVKDVLSERGNVTVDIRTNTLIVRDLPENMGKVRSMVTSLDLQTPQVLIEARIVEANVSFAREVGIQWGGQALMSSATGNPTGLLFPSSVALTGGVAGATTGTSGAPNYAVSLPVGASDGNGGALGMVFGSAGGAAQLNLRLTALERQGSLKTISAPKISTLDNVSAKISQGVDIPFLTTSAAGASVSFVQARLSLDVTPHITQDASVLMQISAQNNQPDPANQGAGGQPGITRKEANTSVLVKDGDTTVIGGIYVRTGSSSSNGLPILSKIPVIGFFFRNSKEAEQKTELLIFVTPRILNRATVAQNP